MRNSYVDIPTRSIVSLDSEQHPQGWTICRVSVLPPHRKQGIATRLLTAVLTDADREGVSLFLEPIPSGEMDRDALIGWYEKLGFRPYGPELGFVWVRRPQKT